MIDLNKTKRSSNNMTSFVSGNRGSILIFALWTLGVLTVFTLSIGLQVQQKIKLLSRLDRRARVHEAAVAGILKAKAVFFNKKDKQKNIFSKRRKVYIFNNPGQFKNIKVGQGIYSVTYKDYETGIKYPKVNYGLVDEERKINVNIIGLDNLTALIQLSLKTTKGKASELAKAIIDWREYGDTEIEGFFSDDYYDNLEYPYEAKNNSFENLDELLLVRGINLEIYEKLLDYITIFGKGHVNINTASKPVLMALGLSEKVADKIIFVRRGPDGKEATLDDVIFQDTTSISAIINKLVKLSPEEIGKINILGSQGYIGVNSSFYKIKSKGKFLNSQDSKLITCVFNADTGKTVYWKED